VYLQKINYLQADLLIFIPAVKNYSGKIFLKIYVQTLDK